MAWRAGNQNHAWDSSYRKDSGTAREDLYGWLIEPRRHDLAHLIILQKENWIPATTEPTLWGIVYQPSVATLEKKELCWK